MMTECITSAVMSLFLLPASMILMYQLAVTFAADEMLRMARVSYSQLVGLEKEVFHDMTMTSCSSMRISRPWANLICYVDRTCIIYGHLVKNSLDPPVAEDDFRCFTAVHPDDCIFNKKLYKSGSITPYECHMHCCERGHMTECGKARNVTCPSQFTYVPDVGCIYAGSISYDNQAEPKSECDALGSQLVIGGDFYWLRAYLRDCHPGGFFYVGIENAKWSDGSDIDPGVWAATIGSNPCGVLLHMYDYFAITAACSSVPPTVALCQIP